MDQKQNFIVDLACMSFAELLKTYLVLVDAARETTSDAAHNYYRTQIACVEAIARVRFGGEHNELLTSEAA